MQRNARPQSVWNPESWKPLRRRPRVVPTTAWSALAISAVVVLVLFGAR